MAIERSATVTWEGSLTKGSGTVSAESSGAVTDLPVTWASRTERADGRTSPEELVAEAHASCYAMALSHALAEAGTPPERLDVRAVVTAELGDDGLAVKASDLTVDARVPGLEEAEFQRLVQEADEGCPISNALRGNLEIRVNASLTG